MSWTFEDIARRVGLDYPEQEDYVLYMRIRWKDKEGQAHFYAYAKEWAERFKESLEYEFSDEEGKQIIKKVRNGEYIAEWEQKDPEDLEKWQADAVCATYWPTCWACPWHENLGYQGSMTLTPGNSIGTNISVYLHRCNYTGDEWETWE